MKKKTLILKYFLIVTILFSNSINAQNSLDQKKNIFKAPLNDSLPTPMGFVNDFENILNEEEENKLYEIISKFEKNTTNEIAIVTISSIKPYENIEKFSLDLSNQWAIGKELKNNGLTIVFSKNLREIRISTGLETEKILTDEICKNVIDSVIIPQFKKGNFYLGIKNGLTQLIENWK